MKGRILNPDNLNDRRIGLRRLEKLGLFVIKKVPRDHFHIGYVAERDHDTIRNERRINTNNLTECGTVACMMGWAPMVPDFKKAGLRLKRTIVPWSAYVSLGRVAQTDRAIEAFFALRPSETSLLFYSTEAFSVKPPKDENDPVYNGRRVLRFVKKERAILKKAVISRRREEARLKRERQRIRLKNARARARR